MITLPTLNRTILFVAFFCATPAYASFSDVPLHHPNAEAIDYVQAQGIVSGYPDGTFKPDQKINRAEFTKIIEESIPDSEDGVGLCPMDMRDVDFFTDVSGNDWFGIYVCMSKGRKVISGYPDGSFRPAESINFAEAAKIIYQANHLDSRGIAELTSITSVPWYSVYTEYLKERNAIPASISTMDQKITRGEMAEMIYRLPSEKQPLLSRKDRRDNDLLTIAVALELYLKDHETLPVQISEGQILEICSEKKPNCVNTADLNFLVPEYLTTIPKDPEDGSNYLLMRGSGREFFEVIAPKEGITNYPQYSVYNLSYSVSVSPNSSRVGWETYMNTKYGYSFKYPPECQPKSDDNKIGDVSNATNVVACGMKIMPQDVHFYGDKPEYKEMTLPLLQFTEKILSLNPSDERTGKEVGEITEAQMPRDIFSSNATSVGTSYTFYSTHTFQDLRGTMNLQGSYLENSFFFFTHNKMNFIIHANRMNTTHILMLTSFHF